MRAGKLRKRFEIQTNTPMREASGAEVPSWTTTATRWGGFEQTGGGESESGGQIQAKASHTVRMRYYSGLSVEQRLKMGSRYFSINSITNVDERNVEQMLRVTESPPEVA